jgi:3-dehydroquinate synthase
MGDLLMFENFTVKSYRRDYNVAFEKLTNDLIDSVSEKSFLFIDSNVNKEYPVFSDSFDNDKVFVIEAAEENKTLEYCQNILKELIQKGIRKNHTIVAVGGGIVQDITAFISSVLYRGIEWKFFPTTLLAQADSCIGSKSSINFNGAKNLLGTFYPPSQIYCCVELLKTLKKDDIKSGIGEILHYYLVDGTPSIHDLMGSYDEILNDYTLINPHICESLQIKKKMIERDEFDEGERRIFNYGHTFGHAIESLTNYEISHGRAVTLGMDLANYISASFGFISWDLYDIIHKLIKKNIPSYNMSSDKISAYFDTLSKDKKNIDDSITCILLNNIGNAEVKVINDKASIKNLVTKYFQRKKSE